MWNGIGIPLHLHQYIEMILAPGNCCAFVRRTISILICGGPAYCKNDILHCESQILTKLLLVNRLNTAAVK